MHEYEGTYVFHSVIDHEAFIDEIFEANRHCIRRAILLLVHFKDHLNVKLAIIHQFLSLLKRWIFLAIRISLFLDCLLPSEVVKQEQEYKLTNLSLRRLVAARASCGLSHDPASIFLLSEVIEYAGQEIQIAIDLRFLLLFF